MTGSPRLRIESMALTDVGRVREVNEDCYFTLPEAGVFAVADGMGGHARGDRASALVVEALESLGSPEEFDAAVNAVADAIHDANARIFSEAQDAGVQMGSTVVAAVFRDQQFAILWAGDSRAYLLRDGLLHRLTRDHTQVQQMIDSGLLTPEGAIGHPMSHVLARAIGVSPDLELDAIADEARPGDIFMLCTDGLFGVVEESEIRALLSDPSVHGDPERLIALALARGAPDNVTVVTITANEPTLLALGGKQEAVS